MSQQQEYYRYAVSGQRTLKYHQSNNRQQQVYYLPGLEVRTDTAHYHQLRLIVAGRCRLYREVKQTQMHVNLNDRLGSVYGVVDETGTLVSQECWYPFGGTASWLTGSQKGAILKFQRYAGKERDCTGLIYYGWRYYLPWLMRWPCSDPAGTIEGLNLFRMVRNNPITRYDTDGRMTNEEASFSDFDAVIGNHVTDSPEYHELLRQLGQVALPVAAPENNLNWQPVASTSSSSGALQPHHPSQQVDDARMAIPVYQTLQYPDRSDSWHPEPEGQEPITPIPFSCVCHECGKQFTRSENFRAHMRIHRGEKPFVCHEKSCNRTFTTKGQLTRHFKFMHLGEKPFKCSEFGCDYSCTRARFLDQHIKIFHAPGSVGLYCTACNLRFETQRAFTLHSNHHCPHRTNHS